MEADEISNYHSILFESNIESIGGDRYIFFGNDLNRTFTDFSSTLKSAVSVFIEYHDEYFSEADLDDWPETYSNLGISLEGWTSDDLLKILNHILDKGKLNFISNGDNKPFFNELNDFLDWVSNVPSYPNYDYVRIPKQGRYPGFIEQWYSCEIEASMLSPRYDLGIEQSSYRDRDKDATLIGWLNILNNSYKWYEKHDAVKFVRQLVHQFNERFEFH